MKKLTLLVIVAVFSFVLANRTLANEGTFDLIAGPGQVGECFVASVYVDASYHLLVSCRDLPVAISAERTRYVLWRQTGNKISRVGEIVAGKLSANVSEKFESLFVTAETDAYTSKPTDNSMLAGNLNPLQFRNISGDRQTVVTPTPTTTGSTTVFVTPTPTAGANRLAGAVIGIGKAIILGFILLLIVVGVLSFLARRRGL